MNIIHLIKAKNWAEKNPTHVIGESEATIAAAELQSNVPFPKAYKEYLFIGGRMFDPISRIVTDLEWLSKYRWPDLEEWLSSMDIDLGRPILVIGDEEGTIIFVYPDEGDNPPVWVCQTEDKGEKDWLRKVDDSLSDYIDWWIDLYEEVNRP